MEEDIKGAIERIEKKLERKADYDTGVWLAQTDIENLIKGYRELEEREIWSTATINGLKRDFIPKSKIKEKIEEYKQEMKEIRAKEKGLIWNHRLHKLDYAIEVLQELIED